MLSGAINMIIKFQTVAAIVAAAWLVSGCQTTSNDAASSPGTAKKELSSYMETTTPKGAGPFPAVMMVSGCSGFNFGGGGFYDDVQANITKLGFVVVRVDSLRFRGKSRCNGGVVSAREQVADIQAASAYLQGQKNIKQGAINLLGWSWGGKGALAAAMVGKAIDAAVAYYPACENLSSNSVTVPTLILHGAADNAAKPALCDSIVAKSKTLTRRLYPGAHHAFDNPALDPPKEYQFGTIGYNKSAAEAAWIELAKFLKH
jgi:dienelactone hydrolase